MRAAPSLVGASPPYTNSNPNSGNEVAVYDNNAAAFFSITGALTVSFAASGPAGVLLRLTAATSWSGTTGDIGNLYIGPGVNLLASAEL